MLTFPSTSLPGDVDDLISVTRENGRSIDDYSVVLSNFSLPPLPTVLGGSILEIGTGQGRALPGLLAMTGGTGHVCSCDIDQTTLQTIIPRLQGDGDNLHLPIGLISPELDSPAISQVALRKGITLVCTDLGSTVARVFPENSFDLGLSIWVFYQIKNKLRALGHLLDAVKPGAPIYLIATGYVAITRSDLDSGIASALRDFVWNHRATRFGWLTGHRELSHAAGELDVDITVMSFVDYLAASFPRFAFRRGIELPELPSGHAIVRYAGTHDEKMRDAQLLLGAEPSAFVSSRHSSFIPIYRA